MKFFGAALAAVLTIFSVSAGKITLTATDSNALKGGIDLLQEYLEKSTGEKPILGNKKFHYLPPLTLKSFSFTRIFFRYEQNGNPETRFGKSTSIDCRLCYFEKC